MCNNPKNVYRVKHFTTSLSKWKRLKNVFIYYKPIPSTHRFD